MADAEQWRASYARQCQMPVVIRSNRPGQEPVEMTVRGRLKGATPEELVAGLDQRSVHVVVLAEDVEAGIADGFPGPMRAHDKVVASGRTLNIEPPIDDITRRSPDGTLIAYEMVARG